MEADQNLPTQPGKVAENNIEKAFGEFNEARWFDWINAFVQREPTTPSVEIGREERHHILAMIYNGLMSPIQRSHFAIAIALVFQNTPAESRESEKLYYLIQLLAYLHPIEAKNLARNYLFRELLTKIVWGGQNLHTLLLASYSKYEVDDDLLDYVKQSALRITDFRYLLVSFRVCAIRGPEDAVGFVETLLPHLTDEIRKRQLEWEIQDLVDNFGVRRLIQWYTQNHNRMSREFPDQFKFLDDILFSERILLEQENVKAADVLKVARWHSDIGKELTTQFLLILWSKIRSRSPMETPWRHLPAFTYQRMLKNRYLCILITPLGRIAFDISDEPEVYEILDQVEERLFPLPLN